MQKRLALRYLPLQLRIPEALELLWAGWIPVRWLFQVVFWVPRQLRWLKEDLERYEVEQCESDTDPFHTGYSLERYPLEVLL